MENEINMETSELPLGMDPYWSMVQKFEFTLFDFICCDTTEPNHVRNLKFYSEHKYRKMPALRRSMESNPYFLRQFHLLPVTIRQTNTMSPQILQQFWSIYFMDGPSNLAKRMSIGNLSFQMLVTY